MGSQSECRRYIRSHEEVQRISIRDRLNDFMQQHGAELAAVLAPELMGIKKQPAMIQNRAVDRSMTYLRDALSVWLETVQKFIMQNRTARF
ncbi:phage polarity suppression protein [Salmonella enterica subsp. arizonae]|nr:phage polarity suppression protein [Salmonella enterica subsp. arizonae]